LKLEGGFLPIIETSYEFISISLKARRLWPSTLINGACTFATTVGVLIEYLLPSSKKSWRIHPEKPCFGYSSVVFKHPEIDLQLIVATVV
jgi:hypothetical protein